MKKICNRLECKKEFESFHKTRTYCCKECYTKNKSVTRKIRLGKKGSFTTQSEMKNNAAMRFIAEMGFDKIVSCQIKKTGGVVL